MVKPLEKETYEKTVQKQRRNHTVTLVCSLCGEDDPSIIEEHHVYGRNNSDEKIPLCINCHAKITREQNKVSPKLRSSSVSPQERRGYLLVTVGALLESIGKTLISLGHEVLSRE